MKTSSGVWYNIRRVGYQKFGSFASCHVTGVFCWPINIAMNKSFLCASMPTYVVTCFTTGSLRCGSGALGR